MDGENNGKPYEQMDDLGGFTPIFGSTPIGRFKSTTDLETFRFGKGSLVDDQRQELRRWDPLEVYGL